MLNFILLAASDVLVKLILDRAMRRSLPGIFEKIDSILPSAMEQRATPLQVKEIIKESIAATTQKNPTESQIEAVIRMYSPAEAVKVANKVSSAWDIVQGVRGVID
jgi:hypothetical protein